MKRGQTLCPSSGYGPSPEGQGCAGARPVKSLERASRAAPPASWLRASSRSQAWRLTFQTRCGKPSGISQAGYKARASERSSNATGVSHPPSSSSFSSSWPCRCCCCCCCCSSSLCQAPSKV